MKRSLLIDSNMEEEGKKKITRTGVVGGGCSRRVLPDDLVFELCLRLPMKKLFQFMCVSKVWRSIIGHPRFPEAYRSHNSSVLVINIHDGIYCSPLSTPGVQKPQRFVERPLKVPSSLWGSTQVVNGLVCFYSSHQVTVFNIWTGESMNLPDPPGLEEGRGYDVFFDPSKYLDYPFGFDPVNKAYNLKRLGYSFGFDPVNRVYKLLKLNNAKCEILTLGSSDSSWRKLAIGAPKLETESFLVNGFLFWCSYDQKLISFDLNEEKFRYVQPPKDARAILVDCWFAQSKGRFLLIRRRSFEEKLILFALNDNLGCSWTRHEITLPVELQTRDGIRAVPVGSLSTGEILLADSKPRGSLTRVYCYDYEKDKFEKMVVGMLPSAKDFWIVYTGTASLPVYCLEQNFGTLEALIRGDGGI